MKDADQFRALLRLLARITTCRTGREYPAMLFLTGANDPRVDPMQSRKMTARLQAAAPDRDASCCAPRRAPATASDTALSERIEEAVDVFAFLFDQLGVKA